MSFTTWLSGLFERRSARVVETQGASLADITERYDDTLDGGDYMSEEQVYGLTPVWCAINFIGSTIASTPIQLYEISADGNRETIINDDLAVILNEFPNEHMTRFVWLKAVMRATLLRGRSFTYIERKATGQPVNLWHLDPNKVQVTQPSGSTELVYQYRASDKKTMSYMQRDIIDVRFLMRDNLVDCISPVQKFGRTFRLCIDLERYARDHFSHGGMPLMAMETNAESPEALKVAIQRISTLVRKSRSSSNVMTLPKDHELKNLSSKPDESQMISARRFQVEEISRIFQLPAVFLHDLTKGTYANTEQQDIQLAKHTILHWVEQIEQELNLKIFGRRIRNRRVAFDLSHLMRGDFQSRVHGMAAQVNSGLRTPNEQRALDHYPPIEGGDELRINPHAKMGEPAEPQINPANDAKAMAAEVNE